jgi:hypothetical protein
VSGVHRRTQALTALPRSHLCGNLELLAHSSFKRHAITLKLATLSYRHRSVRVLSSLLDEIYKLSG